MTQPDDAQRLSSLRSLHGDIQRDADSLLDKVRFTTQLEAVTRRQGGLAKVNAELERLHGRGFLWTAPMLTELDGLDEVAESALRDARHEGDRASAELRARADVLHRKIAGLQPELHMEQAIRAVGAERDTLEKQVDAAGDHIEALTRPFITRYDAVERAVNKAHSHMDRFEEAIFSMLPEENPLATVKATWEDAPEGKTEGVLFLTDLRVRFEARTKVAKKKFLFITTESEVVKKVLFDEAIGHITESVDSKRGLVMKDQLLVLTWAREAGVRGDSSTFELDEGTAAEWDALVEEIRSGALARRRRSEAAPAGGAPIGTPVSWPEKCRTCDAPMPPPVKGQTSVMCPYCGQAHAITIVGA